MKIGFDLNDVYRDYTTQFAKYYKKEIDEYFNLDDNKITDVSKYSGFKFNNKKEYERFLYEDYTLEIFGHAQPCSKNLPHELNQWLLNLTNLDENNIIPSIVSTKEHAYSIHASLFFLSKTGTKIRNIYLGKKHTDVWETCDTIITANPDIINNKPHDKIVIKITTDYNKDSKADYEYANLSEFLSDKNIIPKLNIK